MGDAELAMDLGHWVNDGLMALFFFVIGLEVRYELSVGSLNDRRRIMIPGPRLRSAACSYRSRCTC